MTRASVAHAQLVTRADKLLIRKYRLLMFPFLAKLQLDSFKVGRALAKIYVLALCFLLFYSQCRSARMARQRLMDQALHKMKLCCILVCAATDCGTYTPLLQSELHPHFNLNIYLSILSY